MVKVHKYCVCSIIRPIHKEETLIYVSVQGIT